MQYLILSRVIEKTGIYATELMKFVLTKIDEKFDLAKNFHTFEAWSDKAPQFANRRVLMCVAYHVMDHKFRKTAYQFGCEEHFKSVIDAEFGVTETIRNSIQNTVTEAEEVFSFLLEPNILNNSLHKTQLNEHRLQRSTTTGTQRQRSSVAGNQPQSLPGCHQ